MSNPLKGQARLPLSDGRELKLEYDFDGLIALEEAAGMKMPQVYEALKAAEKSKDGLSLRIQRAIIYGGLQMHHPEMTLKEAGNIILSEAGAFATAMSAISGAHGPAEGGQAGEAEADPPQKGSGIGANSSKHGAAQASTRKASGSKRLGATSAA
jgi:hypothetical protein